MKNRSLLGACLALPLAAVPALAAQPGCNTAQPLPMGVTPSVIEAQAARMIADANAMFRRMAAEMNAMQAQMAALMQMPLPGPEQMVQAGFGPAPAIPLARGSGTMIRISSAGNGICSETITYSYPANGGQPIVHVVQRGNACGNRHLNGPGMIDAAQPAPRHAAPEPVLPRHNPQLIEAAYQ